MPPKSTTKTTKPTVKPNVKSTKPTKPTKTTKTTKTTKSTIENNNDDKIPALDIINTDSIIKERYEYNPVIRTEIIYKLPEDRITSEVMTKYELAEVISIRARQLELNNNIVFVDVDNLTNPLDIAKKEILEKKCPLSIVRMITNNIAEKWHVNEMAIPLDENILN